jgi:CheY-like chemotaxis protein
MHMLPDLKAEPAAARVLLVEDEVMLRVWIAEELRDAGFTVIEAKSADEASAIIASGTPVDLIFSDVRMPGSMNGLEFARQVRAQSPTLPIIITSGDLGPEGTGGLAPLLKKPYSVAQAIALLSEALGRSRSGGES